MLLTRLFLCWLCTLASAARIIKATSLVPCMANSGVKASKFDVTFSPDNKTLSFDVSVNVAVQGYVYADITLYAYGFSVLTQRVNPCKDTSSIKQLCPLYSGEIDIQSQTQVSAKVIKDIPGVAFTVPNIDAFALVKVYSVEGNQLLACIRAELSNTKTVSHTAVKWVTAIISGLGLLISALFAYFGSPWTSQHIDAVSMLMFQYFQSMVIVDMEAVERVPPIANAWSENVAWSVGIVYVKFMQQIFRWYVQATGGNPSTKMIYDTVATIVQRFRRSTDAGLGTMHDHLARVAVKSASALHRSVPPRVGDFVAFQRQSRAESINALHTLGSTVGSVLRLGKRDNELAKETFAQSSSLLEVYRGIERVAFDSKIEDTSIVLTSFTIYIFVCVCVAAIFLVLFFLFFLMSRRSGFQAHRHASMFAPEIPHIFKGMILRLVFMSFPAVMIFSLWEFVKQDSAAVIVVAVIFLVLTLAIVCWTTFKVFLLARRSVKESGTAAYLLYSDVSIRHRYGSLFAMYNAEHYFFIPISLAYNFVKALFIAFSQSNGKVQGLALFIIELIMLILVCWKKPYLDKSTNAINIVMQVIITLNALFFAFFSNLFTQPLAVNAVMGVIYFILNAAFSLVLLLYTIIYGLVRVCRRNPDAGVAPAKDDRMSFISEKGPYFHDAAGELTALGAAAQAGHEGEGERPDWFETENTAGPKNPFDGPPAPREPHTATGSRADTMLSSTSTYPTLDVPHLNDPKHRATESQTSFGVSNKETSPKVNSKKRWFG